jgi:hypothetical protein
MDDEDEYEVEGYAHINDRAKMAKKIEKETSALGHFKVYLERSACTRAPESFAHNEITSDLFGKFATYLSTHAVQRNKREPTKLSLSSALGYMGSMKSYYLERFRDRAPPAVFLKENWSTLLASITSEFVSYARKNNVALVNPHSAATVEDRAALATVCFWSNNKKGIFFLHFTNSMVHCVGRGSEIAATRLTNH